MSAASASAPTLRLTSPISTPASGRACTARIAQTCIVLLPPSVGRGGVPPYFCNGFGLRRHFCSTRPLRLTMPTSAPASTFCMRPRLGSRIDPLALPKAPPAPRSELECKILPLICSPGRRSSGAGDPDTLACHALLNAMSSRTKSPELPLVLYGTAPPCSRRISRAASGLGTSEPRGAGNRISSE